MKVAEILEQIRFKNESANVLTNVIDYLRLHLPAQMASTRGDKKGKITIDDLRTPDAGPKAIKDIIAHLSKWEAGLRQEVAEMEGTEIDEERKAPKAKGDRSTKARSARKPADGTRDRTAVGRKKDAAAST